MQHDELLERTMSFIEDNPNKWDQQSWRSCFAGRAATLLGWHCLSPGGLFRVKFVHGIPRFGATPYIAQQALGLSEQELEEMTRCHNTAEKLRWMVDSLMYVPDAWESGVTRRATELQRELVGIG